MKSYYNQHTWGGCHSFVTSVDRFTAKMDLLGHLGVPPVDKAKTLFSVTAFKALLLINLD